MSIEEALNPETTPERLTELSTQNDAALNAAIAKNPNAPTPLLCKLWALYPRAFEENPIVELLLLESPQFWGSLPVETLKGLLTLPSIPSDVLERLSTHWSFDLRPLVAKHLNTSPSALHRLSTTYPLLTQENIAKNPNTLPETLLLLLGSREKGIAAHAASHPKTPAEIVALFRRVGGQVSSEPPVVDLTLTSDEMKPLFSCGLGVISLVQSHPNISEEYLVELYQRHKSALDFVFSSNPRLPARCMRDIAERNSSGYMFLSLAKNPSSTEEVLAVCLRKGCDQQTKLVIAQRADLSLSLQETLANDRDDAVPLELLKNPSASISTLLPLQERKNWQLRAALAARSDAPPSVLEALSGDDRERVRLVVAANAMTPVTALRLLLTDEDEGVRAAARKNPGAPQQDARELDEIMSDPETPAVRLSRLMQGGLYAKKILVEHPNTPMALIYQLAASPQVKERQLVAQSHKTPPGLLVRLASDPVVEVRAAVAANVATPIPALETLSGEEKIGFILQSLASNRSVPVRILEGLLELKSRNLREHIAQNPAAPPAMLKKIFAWLETNTSPHTLRALLDNPNLPASLWTKLGAKHGRVLAQHPRVIALPQQREDGYQAISVSALCAVLQQPELSVDFLLWASEHPNPAVRAEAAGHPKTPASVLRKLLRDDDPVSLLRKLAKNPNTPQAILLALVKLKDRGVYMLLLHNANTPLVVLRWFATDNPFGLGRDAQRKLGQGVP